MLLKLRWSVITCFITAIAFSCNNSSSAKDSKGKKQDTAQIPEVTVPVTPPEITVSAPAGSEAGTKCFSNEGLKYATVITIIFGEGNAISGDVTAQELGTDAKQTVKFSGTRNGNTLSVKFAGEPPVVGAASQWTGKPWTMEEGEGKSNGKEKLHIPFNAKNYETNKWEDTHYEFVLVPCQ